MINKLVAISPLDGRYIDQLDDMPYFCEYSLMLNRVIVECEWVIKLFKSNIINDTPYNLDEILIEFRKIYTDFSIEDATEIKYLEHQTNHDVKAVEYFLKEKISNIFPDFPLSFIHFGCTSEDINNIAHACMLKDGRKKLHEHMENIIIKFDELAVEYSNIPMLSRTHGQPASPTTLGKELKIFAERLRTAHEAFMNVKIKAKMNGATGNFNAHHIAFPDINWKEVSNNFINHLGFVPNEYTTQIEPHDYIAEMFNALSRFNTILIGIDRDIWGYISMGYFKQRIVEGEVGSSTMPHKVNPIDFENSEGNLGLANAILDHMASKLTISRWQRDLSDSTVLRNMGVGFGYSLIAFKSSLSGINKLIVNEDEIFDDLDNNWEVLTEAIQMVMRANGIDDAYEQLKDLSRGQRLTQKMLMEFILGLDIPEKDKDRLIVLRPEDYIGYANRIV